MNYKKRETDCLDGWGREKKDKLGAVNNFLIQKTPPKELIKYPMNKIEIRGGILWEHFLDNDAIEKHKDRKILKRWVEDYKDMDLVGKLIFQCGEKYCDFEQFLPPHSFFAKHRKALRSSLYCRTKLFRFSDGSIENSNLVYYRPEILDQDDFLSLFHEIGHAHKAADIIDIELYKLYEKNLNIRCARNSVNSPEELEKFFKKYSSEERGLILQDERDAWAWAIRTSRALKRLEFDLDPHMDKSQILSMVNDFYLKNYEIDFSITARELREIRNKSKIINNEKK